MAKIWMQGKERFMCPVCKNEELELGQKYCQICGEPLEWEEDKQDHFVEMTRPSGSRWRRGCRCRENQFGRL